jgi:hypothetical protein
VSVLGFDTWRWIVTQRSMPRKTEQMAGRYDLVKMLKTDNYDYQVE